MSRRDTGDVMPPHAGPTYRKGEAIPVGRFDLKVLTLFQATDTTCGGTRIASPFPPREVSRWTAPRGVSRQIILRRVSRRTAPRIRGER